MSEPFEFSLAGLSRSDFTLRISSEQELSERAGEVAASPKETLDRYYFITCHRPDVVRLDVYLIGYPVSDSRARPTLTSALKAIDREAGRVLTRRGSIYQLGTAATADEPDVDYIGTLLKGFRPNWRLASGWSGWWG
jgi:hypothetical protein